LARRSDDDVVVFVARCGDDGVTAVDATASAAAGDGADRSRFLLSDDNGGDGDRLVGVERFVADIDRRLTLSTVSSQNTR